MVPVANTSDLPDTPADPDASGHTADSPVTATATRPVGYVAEAGEVVRPGAPARTGSRFDDLLLRLVNTPLRYRIATWGAPIAVLVLALILRVWNLANPHALVFDETFYVKDSYTLWNNGFESTWPENPNPRFEAGDTDIFTSVGSFIVHPPLGKWMIALGIAAFGVDNPVGWRITTVLCGVILVGLTMAVTWTLLRSHTLTVIAGFLLAIDSNAIVMSRVALLDGILAMFALLGVYFILRDRGWNQRVLRERLGGPGDTPSRFGPVVWNRPWLIAAGVAFGAASSVKWSGLYFLAAFGLYLIVVDVLERRRLGIERPIISGVFRQGPVTFLLYVPVALVTYLLSWTGWFVTSGGYNRQWAADAANAWTGPFAWVPESIQSFVHYHQQIYAFHVGLSSPHPYSSEPAQWLLMIRPTSMWYESPTPALELCGSNTCSQAITGTANPLIWYAAVAATLYLVWRLTRHLEWKVGFILMGMVAGYLPWLMYTGRTVFQFYSIAFVPYLIIGLVFVIGLILGTREDDRQRRTRGLLIVGAFLVLSVILSIFWFPLTNATTIPYWFWHLHVWMTTWA